MSIIPSLSASANYKILLRPLNTQATIQIDSKDFTPQLQTRDLVVFHPLGELWRLTRLHKVPPTLQVVQDCPVLLQRLQHLFLVLVRRHVLVVVVVIQVIADGLTVIIIITVAAGDMDQRPVGGLFQHLPHKCLHGGLDYPLPRQDNAVHKVVFCRQKAMLREDALVVPVDNLKWMEGTRD